MKLFEPVLTNINSTKPLHSIHRLKNTKHKFKVPDEFIMTMETEISCQHYFCLYTTVDSIETQQFEILKYTTLTQEPVSSFGINL